IAPSGSLFFVPPHIPPPIAQAPNPTTDASIPDFPNGRYFIFLQLVFAAFATFLFKTCLSGLAVFSYVSLSQVPMAAHDPGYAHLIVTSPANGTNDIAGDGDQHADTPAGGQKDTDLRE